MKALLADLWAFSTGRTDSPIYRRELAKWSRLPAWRWLWLILLSVAFGGVAVLGGLPMTVWLPPSLFPLHSWSSLALATLFVLLAGQEIAKQLACLSATALTGAAISAGVGDQPPDLLRLTPLSARQIALARLGAVLLPLRLPLLMVLAARLLLVLAATGGWEGLLYEPVAMFVPPSPFFATVPSIVAEIVTTLSVWAYRAWSAYLTQLDAVQMMGIWPLWLAYYLVQPVLDLVLFVAVGLFAASQARVRGSGLAAALGLGTVLWVSGYLLERGVSILLTLAWPVDRPWGLVVVPPEWVVGALAMSGGFIVVGGCYAVMLLSILFVKLGLLWLLLRATARRLAASVHGHLA